MLLILTPTVANAATQVSPPASSLTASWWQKFVAISGKSSFSQCDVGTNDILFLAGTTGGSATRSCTTDKTNFLVPLINVECSAAEGDGTTFKELRTCAKGFADDFTNLNLVVDDQPVNVEGLDLRIKAESTFTSVGGNIFHIPKTTDSKFAADGYWALITLTPGQHTITFGGSYTPPDQPPAFTTEVTYTLIVQN
jgi:hypothetical protein